MQVRRWQEEGGMHVLSGTRTFKARQMSGSYMHPEKLPGIGVHLSEEGIALSLLSPRTCALCQCLHTPTSCLHPATLAMCGEGGGLTTGPALGLQRI